MAVSLVVIIHPTGSEQGQRALALAHSLRQKGVWVKVALLQDAVLAALDRNRTPPAGMLRDLSSHEVPIYVAEEDLVMRGFGHPDLIAGAVTIDDRALVDLILAEGTTTLGCF